MSVAATCVAVLFSSLPLVVRIGPPEDESSPPPESSDVTHGEAPASPKDKRGSKSKDGPPLDERGDPILEYGEADPEAEGLKWADTTPPEPELQYAESPKDPAAEAGVVYAERPDRPPPSEAALERQNKIRGRRQARDRNYASPQRFAFELKFGPYVPGVDRRYDGPGLGPYAQIYGETNSRGEATGAPKPGLITAVHFEWQFAKAAGPFGLGTSIGIFQDKANALIAMPEPDDTSVRSKADTVRFTVIPTSLVLLYRFELLADRFKVPLVPYVKGGLAYGFWLSRDGTKSVSRNSTGEKGRGGSLGWTAVLGMMLRLDFIDMNTARDLDRTTGINHTYLFGEYQFMRLNGFGRNRGLDVGADTFFVGLAMEF